MGVAFLVFFSVTHKIGLFSPKIEAIRIALLPVIVDVPRRSAHIPVAQSWWERLSWSSSSSLSAVERR